MNGKLIRRDKDLVYKFHTTEIPGFNIVIGPYPQIRDDVKQLSEDLITTVICVQWDSDFKRRKIDMESIKGYYKEYNINFIHKPIIDFDEDELKKNLKEGIDILYDLLEKQSQRVFIHWTMGIYRSVSIVIGYLSIYKGNLFNNLFRFHCWICFWVDKEASRWNYSKHRSYK